MKVLVFESNLLWSSKLKSGLAGLGHEAVVLQSIPESPDGADAAIVNLGQPFPPAKELINWLRVQGVRVIAHAGHKESELLRLGKEAGADYVATNGALSANLSRVIAEATQ